jgi:hypothetical protein
MKKTSDLLPEQLPAHHSPVRSMIAEANGADYVALESFEMARRHPQSAVVFEGDEGGTIYVTAPMRHVSCTEDALNALLLDIDAMCWQQPEMAHVYYEVLPIGAPVAGGMGGGLVIDGIWLHPELEALSVRQQIADVLKGARERINIAGKRWS